MHTAPAEVIPDPESPPDQPETTTGTTADDQERAPEATGAAGSQSPQLRVLAVSLILLAERRRSNSPTSANSRAINRPRSCSSSAPQGNNRSGAIARHPRASARRPAGSHTHHHPHDACGTRVKQGDLLVEFDRQAQMRDFIDKQADYAKLVDQVAEEQAKESAARAKDETELKTAEDNLRKTELEIQKAEIVSRIDAEKNQENLDEAKATYEQLRETFDLKRKAAQAAIRILEIQRDRTQQTMLHAQANADLMQIHSPLDGVVVLNTIWKQGTMGEVQEGDQVRPGVPFMQVVNPATMQVRVMANQQDFPSLQVGQTAKVRLDAYPDLVFAAKLDQLAPIGEGGDFSDKLRSFVVIVSIAGK